MEHIPFRTLERKWQGRWEQDGLFQAPEKPERRKYYVLVMFPYPSGRAHMGHLRNYTIGDVIARKKLMEGFDVLQPIGWDAFGLPAENAAIKNKVEPETWTRSNIAAMKDQFKSWGIGYDWSREFATCDAEYYRWNQWIFVQMFRKGLAFKKKSPVNFCPSCLTVLANEQVTHQLTCWRCDSPVKEKELEQWFLKITDYAQELLDSAQKHLAGNWPDEVLAMQRHWIGRSEGAEVDFEVPGKGALKVFTTRPDTLFGATFLVLSPEHPLALEVAAPEQKVAVRSFIDKAKRLTIAQRTDFTTKGGVFTGAHAMNPVNGEKLPVWISDYVLMEYGTGAIMAVPAHDQRDHDFATAHKIPIRTVIEPKNRESRIENRDKAFEEDGVLVNSGEFDGMASAKARAAVTEKLAKAGKGKAVVRYRLKDWLISRQRAWGTPIPVVKCAKDGLQAVPESELPVLLPKGAKYTGKGESPLAAIQSFVKAKCPKCGGPAERETDTMDTFVDSSWYYARYLDPENDSAPFDKAKAAAWLPVDQYIGGIEHAILHLIYARFFHKVLRDLGLASGEEPFARLLSQGMVTLGGAAMSKSKGNIVDPQEYVAKYGADTVRLFILFAAPPEKGFDWSDEGVEGAYRFLNRVWRLRKILWEEAPSGAGQGSANGAATASLRHVLHTTIQKVRQTFDQHGYNSSIAGLMELTNALYAYPGQGDTLSREAYARLIQLLAPFAPHAAEELWELTGHQDSVFRMGWPEPDPKYLVQDVVEIAVQINGKLRERLSLAADAKEGEAKDRALALPRVQELVKDKSVAKVIFVPQRLINIVIK